VRILVTGGAGYIGSTLLALALREGHALTVLDRVEPPPALAMLSGVRYINADIRERDILRRAMVEADAVVHLAAVSGRPACDRDPVEAISVNVDGTRAVCEAAAGRPLVFASTGSVYGAVPDGLCTEETPARPVSLYGTTKLEAEKLACRMPGGVCLRLATCYGLSPCMRLDLLVNHFVDVLLRDGRIRVFEPEARRTFLHVSDAARAILHVLALPPGTFEGSTFNTGDEAQNISKRGVLEIICAQLPGAVVEYVSEGTDPDRRDYAVSYTRIRSTGFRAAVGMQDGIRRLIDGFRGGSVPT
jgi:nucleoside-diphosphate-sugar epimerase